MPSVYLSPLGRGGRRLFRYLAIQRRSALDTIKPDKRNARKHTPRNVATIESSIQRDGFGRSILLANDGTVIAGNATYDAAASAGLDDVLIVETDGTKVVAVKRTDVEPGSERFHMLALSDNRAAELAEWDPGVLVELSGELDLSGLFRDDELAGIIGNAAAAGENPYTLATRSPMYEPTGDRPQVADLANTSRRDELLQEIAKADVSEDVRRFLETAAERHVVFDYRRIAEFYAHASGDVRRLMENSALVIIDFDRAIELGYVRLSERIEDILAAARANG